MILEQFPVFISNRLVVVVEADRRDPWPIWTQINSLQGFAWARGVVMFASPPHEGECLLQVCLESGSIAYDSKSTTIIQCPFELRRNDVTIGSIGDDHRIELAKGYYGLVYEIMPGVQKEESLYRKYRDNSDLDLDSPYIYVLKCTFYSETFCEYKIVRPGEMLSSTQILEPETRCF